MTILLAIEGADGVGKHTAAYNVQEDLRTLGIHAAVISFPRYRSTVGGVALGEFLAGRTPVPVSAQAAAVLYALDRMESIEVVERARADSQVVILDRYIASNMAYQASKVPRDEADALMRWIWELETSTFQIRPPDLSVYLAAPTDQAQELILRKDTRSYTERKYDEHEADLALQELVRYHYQALASSSDFGPWCIVQATQNDGMRPPKAISAEIVLAIQDRFSLGSEQRRLIA